MQVCCVVPQSLLNAPSPPYPPSPSRPLAPSPSQVDPVTLPSGRTLHPSQCTSTYIFPGVGLGALISRCTKLRDEQFIAAADAVSRMVGEDDLARGSLFPALSKVRVGVGPQHPVDDWSCTFCFCTAQL